MKSATQLRHLAATIAAAAIIGTAGIATAATTTATPATPVAPPQVAQCAGCHGANGMGNPVAGFPALAGQPTAYLEHQLYAFKHGTRRNAIMKSFATGLTAADRKAIATYYNSLPVVAPASLPAAPSDDLGKTIALHGAGVGTAHVIPACASCHAAGGLGRAPAFPRLAGQPEQYLEAQLIDWRKGSRNESNLHLMRNIAKDLTAQQIKAVAQYYASLPPTGTSGS
ncbi:c-type cytochrome [Acidiphilium acidophilum]|uniref:c-type cytochrome n=1 Tax=Acidiphilium acidophilum TaxID=76588 RepID=UPI002E8E7767|nr:c-type cytochrome [Acidiphilium acidophilum]